MIDLSHKFHSVQENKPQCTILQDNCAHFGCKCIVEYGTGALSGLCNRSTDSLNIYFCLANLIW